MENIVEGVWTGKITGTTALKTSIAARLQLVLGLDPEIRRRAQSVLETHPIVALNFLKATSELPTGC